MTDGEFHYWRVYSGGEVPADAMLVKAKKTGTVGDLMDEWDDE